MIYEGFHLFQLWMISSHFGAIWLTSPMIGIPSNAFGACNCRIYSGKERRIGEPAASLKSAISSCIIKISSCSLLLYSEVEHYHRWQSLFCRYLQRPSTALIWTAVAIRCTLFQLHQKWPPLHSLLSEHFPVFAPLSPSTSSPSFFFRPPSFLSCPPLPLDIRV